MNSEGPDDRRTAIGSNGPRRAVTGSSLRLLRAFLVVGEEGNVGRAAARLYVSQPSMSQDIRRLERDVGFTLFVRGPKGMSLTPAGAEFARSVEAGLLIIDRGVAEAQDLAAGEQRTIVIAYSPSVGNRLMPELLPVLEERLPGYRIDEQEVDTGSVGPGVARGQYDVGFAHCPSASPGLTFTLLVSEPLCVALASSHQLATEGRLRLADLEDLDLLIWPRAIAPEYYDRILALCTGAGLVPRGVREFRRALTRSYLVVAGQTFCLLPLSTASAYPPGVSFLMPDDVGISVDLELIRRGEDHRDVLDVIEHEAHRLSQRLSSAEE